MIAIECLCIPVLLLTPPPEKCGSANQQQQEDPSERPANNRTDMGGLLVCVICLCWLGGGATVHELGGMGGGDVEAVETEGFRLAGIRDRKFDSVIGPRESVRVADEPVPGGMRIARSVWWSSYFQGIPVDGTCHLWYVGIGPVKGPNVHTPDWRMVLAVSLLYNIRAQIDAQSYVIFTVPGDSAQVSLLVIPYVGDSLRTQLFSLYLTAMLRLPKTIQVLTWSIMVSCRKAVSSPAG